VIPAGFEPAACGLGSRDLDYNELISHGFSAGPTMPLVDPHASSCSLAPSNDPIVTALLQAQSNWLRHSDRAKLRRALLALLYELER